MDRPDCPDCGNPLARPFLTCSCGWRSKKAVPFNTAKRCCWNDFGVPCDKVGHMSTGTTGDGPWYCRDHFADLMGWVRYEVKANLPIAKRTPGDKESAP